MTNLHDEHVITATSAPAQGSVLRLPRVCEHPAAAHQSDDKVGQAVQVLPAQLVQRGPYHSAGNQQPVLFNLQRYKPSDWASAHEESYEEAQGVANRSGTLGDEAHKVYASTTCHGRHPEDALAAPREAIYLQ